VPRLEYAAEDHQRFRACALALHACNEIGQRILTESEILAAKPGSLADHDLSALKARDPTPPVDLLDIVTAGTVGPHVYAACEHIGALSVLYAIEEIHVTPMVLARTVIEHCAHALWILGSKGDSADDRLARALLDYLNGLQQAERYAREFLGEASPGHVAKQGPATGLRTEAHALFSPPYKVDVNGRKRSALGGEHFPAHTEIVVRAANLMNSSLNEQEARGIYALLSTRVHATPTEITGLTILKDPLDPTSIALREDRRTHEPLVRLVVSFFYSAMSHALDYSGIAIPEHNELGDEIEKHFPGHFRPSRASGPFR
jgi:hypothetical protein